MQCYQAAHGMNAKLLSLEASIDGGIVLDAWDFGGRDGRLVGILGGTWFCVSLVGILGGTWFCVQPVRHREEFTSLFALSSWLATFVNAPISGACCPWRRVLSLFAFLSGVCLRGELFTTEESALSETMKGIITACVCWWWLLPREHWQIRSSMKEFKGEDNMFLLRVTRGR
jgi:hypothetical protein